jgi:hypothetical protein
VVSEDSQKMVAIVLRIEGATVFFSEVSQVTLKNIQDYSKVPPGFPNSTAKQPREIRQKGAYQ